VARLLFAEKGPPWTRRPLTGLLLIGVPGAVAILLLHKKIAGPAVMPAILAATWLACVWLFYAAQWRKSGTGVMGAVLLGYAVGAAWLQTCQVSRDRATMAELEFVRQVRQTVPPGQLLTVDAQKTHLDFFRLQYYLPPDTRLLHNLTFLQSRQITQPDVYVITQAGNLEFLRQFGPTEFVLSAVASHNAKTAADRYALFHLTFAPQLVRVAPPDVNVLQAMNREEGPWCGNHPELATTRPHPPQP
jgi:hypothetical protein